MTYNIHPLFVHFPIALLVLYAVLKILPFERWIPKMSWRHVQQILLLGGVLGAMVASSTGEIAEHIVRPDRQIVEMHAFFAAASTWIFGILLVGEILFFLNPYIAKKFPVSVSKFFIAVERIITNRVIGLCLAIVGIIAISVTGLLGGVMVYGTTADPVAPLVFKLLGLQ
jgi:uncharacterized membrane protein